MLSVAGNAPAIHTEMKGRHALSFALPKRHKMLSYCVVFSLRWHIEDG